MAIDTTVNRLLISFRQVKIMNQSSYSTGLYTVEKYWSCTGKSGFKVFKFALRRCTDQAPPPWITGPLPVTDVSLIPPSHYFTFILVFTFFFSTKDPQSTEEDAADADEDEIQKPSVLQVKLFNK